MDQDVHPALMQHSLPIPASENSPYDRTPSILVALAIR
jgi:hypothetical protein